MRLFIAINLNDEMKESLIGIHHTMRAYGMRGNATVPENMHLTLAFIGDYDDPEYVKSVVDSIEISPYRLSSRIDPLFRSVLTHLSILE